jgi:hypothetical protein
MDCGIRFATVPALGNLIPDFNDMVHQEEWETALFCSQQITFLNSQVAYVLLHAKNHVF